MTALAFYARAWTHDGFEVVGPTKKLELAASLDADRLESLGLERAHVHVTMQVEDDATQPLRGSFTTPSY